MDGLLLDLKTAVRQLAKAPATTVAAVLTLAVGIGATTAVFSLTAAALEAGAPVADMERRVALWSHNRSESETKGLVSRGDYVAWSARAQSFDAMVATEGASFSVSGDGLSARVSAQRITQGYLEFFDWRAARGRVFRAEDFTPGAPSVMIASDRFWKNTLGAQSDIVGRSLRLDGEPATVIGVLAQQTVADGIFVPLRLHDQFAERSARATLVWARLKPGVTIEQARSEMEALGSALEAEFPETNRGYTVNTRPLQEEFFGPQARLVFGVLLGTVFAVLLIGCVNIANLLLARGVSRQGELAVRLALGAGGWRITRQLLIECLALAVLGGAASVLISRATLGLLLSIAPIDSPWVASHGLNPRALAVTAVAALAATVIAGLAPALAARRSDLLTGLHATGRSGARGNRRMTALLVGGEVALAVTLIVVSGLLAKTLVALERLDPGFDTSNTLTASVTLPERTPPDASVAWFTQALARARALPGVLKVGATSRLPFVGSRWNPNRGLEIEGRAPDSTQGAWAIDYVITPGYLETLRVALIEGRTLAAGDGSGSPRVVVINQAMARRFWPDRSPLGARLRHGNDPPGTWRTVVGIVADIRNDDGDQPPVPYLYLPLAQQPLRSMTLTVRTANEPDAIAAALRRAIGEFDANQALYDVRTMEEVVEADYASSRLLIRIFGALAIIALGLAGIGVWGVAAHSVGQRTREIGLRVALGATRRQIARLVAWQGLLPVAGGLLIGVIGGIAVGQLLRSVLFQTSPTDLATIAITLIVLASVGVLATLGPALRATRVDPLVALREN